MRRVQILFFGAGGTQGGVKKVSQEVVLPYKKWILDECTRALLAPIHHPLVTEYFLRLNEKRVKLEKMQDHGATDVLQGVKNKDGSTFDFIQWNIQYKEDIHVAENMSGCLTKLNENVILQEELRKGKGTSAEDRDLLPMLEEDIQDLLNRVREMDDDVNLTMEKRLESSDTLATASRTWILEVAGKAGGEEASLFAAELTEVYKAYAALRDWRVEVTENSTDTDSSATNNIRSGTPTTASLKLKLTGNRVYHNLRHEIGVHKVQRVPVTDHDGKMQTSTAVVTLMPVLDPVSVDVHERDCKLEFVRGSGPGGQGMQSSSNAVCLTHKPSGISVKCHQSRSALGNKELALQAVAQQLLARRIKDQNSSLHDAWKNQWSSGERSDKMRTYNYPQNRVTDHRLGKDLPLGSFMEGGSALSALHDDLNKIDDREHLVSVLLRHIELDFGSGI